MKNLKLLFGIIIGFVILLGCIIFADHYVGMLIVNPALNGIGEFAVRTLILIGSCFFISKMYKKSVAPSTLNMTKGLFIYGATVWIIIITNLFSEYKTPALPASSVIPSLIGLFFGAMGTGLLEELVFRGFFFNAFTDRLGDSKKSIFASMFLSSSIFGLTHLINLISHPELFVATISQVIYAILIGCIFCVIYYRTQNIWPGIILHGLIDFTGKFWECFNPAPITDSSILIAIIEVAVCLILFVSAIVQLNKEFKNKEAAI